MLAYHVAKFHPRPPIFPLARSGSEDLPRCVSTSALLCTAGCTNRFRRSHIWLQIFFSNFFRWCSRRRERDREREREGKNQRKTDRLFFRVSATLEMGWILTEFSSDLNWDRGKRTWSLFLRTCVRRFRRSRLFNEAPMFFWTVLTSLPELPERAGPGSK